MKSVLTFCFLVMTMVTSLTTHAQTRNGQVKGKLTDSVANTPLANATINVLDAKDSTLLSFGRSNSAGEFTISRLKTGDLILLVTYTGFGKLQQPFTLSEANPIKDFGTIGMTSNSVLENVTVTAAPVTIKGDTVEYNAGSFKLNKPNAVVEDLLKRLPGVEVDKEGNIKANGQDVKRILVDGKEFFANDPKLATKNLQADMVNKVQVFEKKTDRAEFTGFDDGDSEPTINLTLKNDKRVGVFGRVSGGYGTDDRYKANASINSFKQGEQLSFIGQANNTNERGFSFTDALSFSNAGAGRGGMGQAMSIIGGGSGLQVAGFGGGGSQGISSTQAAGLNYNNFKNKKVDFTSSYFFNGTQTVNDYLIRRELNVADSTQLYVEPGSTQRNNFNHRLNLGADIKLDSFNSLKLTSRVSFQQTDNETRKIFSTLGPKGNMLSDGNNFSANNSDGYNLFGSALWRHKFLKKGRTFSADLNFTNIYSDGDGSLLTINNRYGANGNTRRDTLDQRSNTLGKSLGYGVTLSYTEPLSRRSLLELSLFHNSNASVNDVETFDRNRRTGIYDVENDALTNFFENDYLNSGLGVNFKENRSGWNYTIGGRLQRAELTSTVQGKTEPISQTFLNFLPSAQLQIGKNRYRNFRVFYNGRTQNPSVQQLQPIPDISDPLNIKIGNADLKQSFTNTVRIQYTSFDPYTMRNFFAFFNAGQTFNDIVNNDSIGAFGTRVTTYENVNGVYNLNGNVNFGFPIRIKEDRINLNFSTSGTFRNTINLLNDRENVIKNLVLTQRATASFAYKELFDLSLSGNFSWNNARYSLQAAQNTNFLSYGGSFDVNVRLPKNFLIQTDISYNGNSGRAAGFNPNFTLWNASIGKSFLKNNKGEVRLSVFDLLKQNTGVQRDVNGNFVQDTRYTVLQQYFMLTFTYNLSRFGAAGMPGMPRGPMMMMRQ